MPDVPPLTLPQPPADDLFGAAEDTRAADYPDIPAEMLAAVLAAERDNLDDRVAASRAVGRAIDTWLTANRAAADAPAGAADSDAQAEGGDT